MSESRDMPDSSSQPENTPNPIQDLGQSITLITEAIEALASQKKLLRQRGMNLPPMVLETLTDIRGDLNTLEDNLVGEHTELSQLRALADMSADMTTSLQVDKVLEETMDIVLALTRAERGYVILVDEDSGDLDYRIQRDNSLNPAHRASGKPKLSSTILNEVLDTGEPLLADNAYKDERFEDGVSIVDLSLRSVLCVPLQYRDKLLGLVYVDNRLQSGLFTEREKNTLTAFANTAAVAMTNAQLYEEIQQALDEITRVKELMDNVFESIGSGIIATDADDVITTYNRAAEDILEIPEADTVGQLLNVVLPKITADLSDHLSDIRDRQEAQALDAELMTTERGRIAVSMKLTPLQDNEQQAQGVAIVLDDVTDKREREQQLRIMKNYLPPEMVDNIHTISNLALGGERREVTCLFAEVRSLKTLKDVRPGEIMDTLNRYLAVATDCIHETRGIVDKYMGTEVMAIWNTQLSPQETHAALAVKCALMMRERFRELYAELGLQPKPEFYRIGLHTGVATLGNVGSLSRRDFTAIGDTINLSKRLEETASYGQIIISDSTRQHLTRHSDNGDLSVYQFSDLPPVQVKGRQQQTRIYEVFTDDAS